VVIFVEFYEPRKRFRPSSSVTAALELWLEETNIENIQRERVGKAVFSSAVVVTALRHDFSGIRVSMLAIASALVFLVNFILSSHS